MNLHDLCSQSSRWRASPQQLADEHIADLSAICQRAAARGDPGLVDLNRTLKQARRLRRVIRRQVHYANVLEKMFEALAYIAAVAKRIYSLLNNWNSNRKYTSEESYLPAQFSVDTVELSS